MLVGRPLLAMLVRILVPLRGLLDFYMSNREPWTIARGRRRTGPLATGTSPLGVGTPLTTQWPMHSPFS